jgi:hypothetical protein
MNCWLLYFITKQNYFLLKNYIQLIESCEVLTNISDSSMPWVTISTANFLGVVEKGFCYIHQVCMLYKLFSWHTVWIGHSLLRDVSCFYEWLYFELKNIEFNYLKTEPSILEVVLLVFTNTKILWSKLLVMVCHSVLHNLA